MKVANYVPLDDYQVKETPVYLSTFEKDVVVP